MRAAAVRIAVAIPLVLAAATLFTVGHTVWAWSLVWVALVLLTVGYVHAATSLSETGGDCASRPTPSTRGATVRELPELADLPPEVRALVHAVDRMRDNWAEGDDARKAELWRGVHEACDAVWGRLDSPQTSRGRVWPWQSQQEAQQ